MLVICSNAVAWNIDQDLKKTVKIDVIDDALYLDIQEFGFRGLNCYNVYPVQGLNYFFYKIHNSDTVFLRYFFILDNGAISDIYFLKI